MLVKGPPAAYKYGLHTWRAGMVCILAHTDYYALRNLAGDSYEKWNTWVDSLHKGQVVQKVFPPHDIITNHTYSDDDKVANLYNTIIFFSTRLAKDTP